jgi:hypothetical protein
MRCWTGQYVIVRRLLVILAPMIPLGSSNKQELAILLSSVVRTLCILPHPHLII